MVPSYDKKKLTSIKLTRKQFERIWWDFQRIFGGFLGDSDGIFGRFIGEIRWDLGALRLSINLAGFSGILKDLISHLRFSHHTSPPYSYISLAFSHIFL